MISASEEKLFYTKKPNNTTTKKAGLIFSINLALFYSNVKGGLHIAKLNMKQQSGYEISPNMKALLEIEYPSGADGLTNRISLGSYVEEVMPDGCILIQVPVYRDYNHPCRGMCQS